LRTGTVYTDTIVRAAPERFASEAPYQVILVSLDGGGRVTARVEGETLAIGDRVIELEPRAGVPWFQKLRD
jgi:uncharacterized OB-fold protein